MKLNSFIIFRAIAIIFIIAGHSVFSTGFIAHSVVERTFLNFVLGGTTLFLFISGFLFHHVFFKKFQAKKFLMKKMKNVLLPYLFLGILPILMYVITRNAGFDGYFLPKGTGFINEYLIPIFKFYISGRFILAYWYIPFIILLFLFSPLHIKYIKLKSSYQLLIIFTWSIISVFLQRPIDNIGLLQEIIYFMPIYLIGITASINKELIYSYLKGKDIYLFLIVILLAFYQAHLGLVDSYHKDFFEYGGIDLMYIQKLVLCFFLMIWLKRFESNHNKIIQVVADTSFAVYFIHPFILWFFNKLHVDLTVYNQWFTLIIFVLLLFIICIAIAISVKKFFPKNSRHLIGY